MSIIMEFPISQLIAVPEHVLYFKFSNCAPELEERLNRSQLPCSLLTIMSIIDFPLPL